MTEEKEKKKKTITFNLKEFKEFLDIMEESVNGIFNIDEKGAIYFTSYGNTSLFLQGEIKKKVE